MTDPITGLNAALAGRYRIVRELGEGGMATVYLADDLKHERRVALKVLKPELAAVIGAERFIAEIRTTANLQHPHILPLFESGQADTWLYYVMPYIDGETIRDRLNRVHQMPVDEAVQIARNVAEALDYAHRHGVIHRDIKPANILLADGKPVLSDFGIALAVGVAGGARLTETGLSLGTPHYMSPEQATGDATIGVATDIHALGCVLYEMLVGEPPFTGRTPQAILGRVLTAEPPSATSQRRTVPPNVDATIRKALEKLPADRFASASELSRALGDSGFRHGPAPGVGSEADGPWNRLSIGLAATAIVLALVSAWSVSALRRPVPRTVARFNVTPAQAQRLVTSTGTVDLTLSPDGSRIIYVGVRPGGGTQLWQRRLEDLEAIAIAGTGDAADPDISPDGLSLAFAAEGGIRTLPLAGGPPVTLVPRGGSPSWGSDGFIYFDHGGTIYRVPAGGGEPEAFTAPMDNVNQGFPDALPDGRGLLLTVTRGTAAESRIGVVGPAGGQVREILTGTMARYVPGGFIVYSTARGTLMASPFDLRRLDVTGPAVPLVEGVQVDVTAAAQFALSASGSLLYRVGPGVVSELVWVSRSGTVEVVDPDWTGEFASPSLSPDGRQLAVAIQGETSRDVWVKQLDRGPSSRLTFDGSRNDYPTWTPDGESVTFASNQAGPSFDLWTKRADASAPPVLELDEDWALAEALWSPNGEWLLHRTSTNVQGAGDILMHRRGKGKPVPLVASRFTELAPAFSPNGRWLAYSSNETGRSEVFVVPFPNAGQRKWPVSLGGGTEPLWSHSGNELFYRNGQGDLVAVRVETDPMFVVGQTSVLFSATGYASLAVHRQYDVTPDGERFLMVRLVGGGVEGQLLLVQNFFEEIRARVPK